MNSVGAAFEPVRDPGSLQTRAAGALWIDVAGALVAGLLSVWQQGFRFGINNNVFHIPYVLRWNEEPAFAADAFYQSLPNFTSALWWLLREVATASNIEPLFLAAHVASRVAAFVAIAVMLRGLLPFTVQRAAVLAILAVSPLLHSIAEPGGHGLFIDYFTHSEATWPFVVGALLALVQRRWLWAAFFAALCFDINAFIGLWMLAAYAAFVLLDIRQLRLLTLTAAALVFIVVSAPVAIWIASALSYSTASHSTLSHTTTTSGAAAVSDFSFFEYIRGYFPGHFLIESAEPLYVVRMLAVLGLALWITYCMRWPRWRWALLSLTVVFAVGIPAPYLLDHRLIFNLHLLRVAGVVQFLSVVLIAAAAVQWLVIGRDQQQRVEALALLAGIAAGELLPTAALIAVLRVRWLQQLLHQWRAALGSMVVVACAVVLPALQFALHSRPGLLERAAVLVAVLGLCAVLWSGRINRWQLPLMLLLLVAAALASAQAALPIVSFVALVAACGAAVWAQRDVAMSAAAPITAAVFTLAAALIGAARAMTPAALAPADVDWRALTQWIRTQALRGPVLVPLAPFGVNLDHNFQLHARVPVWVDRKQGAAAMWQPAFYPIWRTRLDAVGTLRDAAAFEAYARSNGIAAMVIDRALAPTLECPGSTQLLYRNSSFAVCALQSQR